MKRVHSNNGDSLSISQIIWIAITITLVLGIGGTIGNAMMNKANSVARIVKVANTNSDGQPTSTGGGDYVDTSDASNSKSTKDMQSKIDDYGNKITSYQNQIDALNNQINAIQNSQQANNSDKNANQNKIKDLQAQIQNIEQQRSSDNQLINNLQNQMNVLDNTTFKYRPMPADGTSLRDVTKPGIYILNGPSSEGTNFKEGNGYHDHHWTDWPENERIDNRSWFHILVVTSAQAQPDDPNNIVGNPAPYVVHQQLITGGYSWDPSVSYERTFHEQRTSIPSYDSQYEWVQDNAGLNNQSSQIQVKDMNQLKTPGIYNFGGKSKDISNLPDNYDPLFDSVLVYKGYDTITQVIIGSHSSYAREIGGINPWTEPWQKL